MPDTRDDQQKVDDALKNLTALEKVRLPFESMVDDVITYVNHGRRKIRDSEISKGGKTGSEVYDGTAITAKNLMRDGLCGYTVSQHFRWFEYALPGKFNFPRWSGMRAWSGKRMDEYPEIKHYLLDREEVGRAAFLRSNFYDLYPDFVDDGLTIGTVTFDIEEDISAGRIVFNVPHFRECYIAEDRYGMVDTNYRVYKISLRNLVDRFGLEKMEKADENFKNIYEKNPYDEKEILRVRHPRKDYDRERLDARSKPFASLWIYKTTKKLIEETGTDDLSSITWRYRINNDERPYGRSPSWDALVEILKSNQIAKTNLKAGHRAVEPPMIAPADLRGKINKGPDGWTFYENFTEKHMPKPLYTNIQLPYGVEQQERSDKIIREYFHVNFFLMLSQAAFEKVEMTATQVLGMQSEQAAILGVRIGRLHSETLNPVHDRVCNIEERAGRMPEIPAILQEYVNILASRGEGTAIETDYLGPLAQAQKRIFVLHGINAGMEFLGRLSVVAPEAMDEINIQETVRTGLDAVSWPASCLNTEEQIKKIREIRQQKREMAEALQQAEQVGKVVQRTSKEVQPGSALDMMMGKGQEGQA